MVWYLEKVTGNECGTPSSTRFAMDVDASYPLQPLDELNPFVQLILTGGFKNVPCRELEKLNPSLGPALTSQK
jgi:hypothetical protein